MVAIALFVVNAADVGFESSQMFVVDHIFLPLDLRLLFLALLLLSLPVLQSENELPGLLFLPR